MTSSSYYADSGVTIDSIDALTDNIRGFENTFPDRGVYFRGQKDCSDHLQPTAGRKGFYWHAGKAMRPLTKKREKDLVHRFRRYSFAYTQRQLGEREALFLARHHGLPVRLLDWTSNPLVALYNAVAFEEDPSKDGAIWVFCRIQNDSKDIDVITETRSPFDIPGVKIIYPVYVSSRLIVQSGCFTLHQYPTRSLENERPSNYKDSDFDICALRKWLVPSCNKAKLLDTLERMSINYRTLFPDLDGLAKGLWHLETIRRY